MMFRIEQKRSEQVQETVQTQQERKTKKGTDKIKRDRERDRVMSFYCNLKLDESSKEGWADYHFVQIRIE